MAVTAETSRVSYTGNNSTVTSYSVPFLFLENSHLAAIAKVNATGVETVVTLANHTGAGNPAGGTVTTAVAVPATSTLTIYRTVPFTQTTSYAEGGDFPAASHERALDKLTMLAQQTSRQINSCLRGSEGVTSNPIITVPNSMIGLDNNNAFKAMTLSEVKSYLSLSGVTLSTGFGIKTFANSGERAIAVPDFTGQLGTQRDTGVVYVSTATAAGSWTTVTPNFGSQNVITTGAVAAGTSSASFYKLVAQHPSYASCAIIATDADSSSALILKNDAREWRIQCSGVVSDNFAIYDETSAATRLSINSSGNLGIGTSAPNTLLHVYGSSGSPAIRVTGDGTSPSIVVERHSSDAFGPALNLIKSRGTFASKQAVQASDNGGSIGFSVFAGQNNRTIAAIFAGVSSYVSDTNVSGDLIFSTANASTSATERMRIAANGNTSIGAVSPLSRLHVDGDVTVSSATTSTTATTTAGGSTLPAAAAGYLVVSINGTSRKVPYYAT